MRHIHANKKTILAILVLLTLCVPFRTDAEATDMRRDAASGYFNDSIQSRNETKLKPIKIPPVTPYALPYSVTGNSYDWHRLWINTATLSGAFVGSLLVLECLPEDATSWNRAELQDVPLFKRWHNHVIKKGPEWDHDKFYFNYILHPYAGAAYFMGARSCGFNFWRSMLYSSLISTVGWEFGIEAFMERPSIQDIFITPIVGSCIGEGFYHVKRWLVDNDYKLFGSSVMGGILAFFVDPVNEFTGLWLGNPARKTAHEKAAAQSGKTARLIPTIKHGYRGFSFVRYF